MDTINSALFIDYDNVATELERYDPALAARFSNKPLTWLGAIESKLEPSDAEDGAARRVIARRCYASPHRINPYRRNFTQTGFEVIDCPPLTTHLKNSADIYIVMDVMDYLSRYPHIDEYIILSGDADFVPVLNRLRKELKRSVIFASYNTTAAYRNCSDQRIEAEFFSEHLAPATAAPRIVQAESATPGPARSPEELSRLIEDCLVAAAKRRVGRLPFATAAHALLNEFGAELGSNWGGKGNFTKFLESIPFERLDVDWGEQMLTIPDFVLDLPGWEAADTNALVEFVTDVMLTAAKHIPLLPPQHYSRIFDELAAQYQGDQPGTFTEAINAVAAICREDGIEIAAQDIRFIATGISMQQYRFVEGADAVLLAALWRAQVYDLCGEPDWMREPEDALLLATWFRASGETAEAARDEFLARTVPADEADAA